MHNSLSFIDKILAQNINFTWSRIHSIIRLWEGIPFGYSPRLFDNPEGTEAAAHKRRPKQRAARAKPPQTTGGNAATATGFHILSPC